MESSVFGEFAGNISERVSHFANGFGDMIYKNQSPKTKTVYEAPFCL